MVSVILKMFTICASNKGLCIFPKLAKQQAEQMILTSNSPLYKFIGLAVSTFELTLCSKFLGN